MGVDGSRRVALGGRRFPPSVFSTPVSTRLFHLRFHPGSVGGWTTLGCVAAYRFRVVIGSGRRKRIMIITVVLVVLALVAAGYVLVSRMAGRPVNTRRLLV